MGCGSSSALAPTKAEAVQIELDYSEQVDIYSLSCGNCSDVQSKGALVSERIRSESYFNGSQCASMLIQGTHIELSDAKQPTPCEIKPYTGDCAHSDCAAPDSEFSGRSTDNTYDPELELELDDLDGETCKLGESLRISGETDIADSKSRKD